MKHVRNHKHRSVAVALLSLATLAGSHVVAEAQAQEPTEQVQEQLTIQPQRATDEVRRQLIGVATEFIDHLEADRVPKAIKVTSPYRQRKYENWQRKTSRPASVIHAGIRHLMRTYWEGDIEWRQAWVAGDEAVLTFKHTPKQHDPQTFYRLWRFVRTDGRWRLDERSLVASDAPLSLKHTVEELELDGKRASVPPLVDRVKLPAVMLINQLDAKITVTLNGKTFAPTAVGAVEFIEGGLIDGENRIKVIVTDPDQNEQLYTADVTLIDRRIESVEEYERMQREEFKKIWFYLDPDERFSGEYTATFDARNPTLPYRTNSRKHEKGSIRK